MKRQMPYVDFLNAVIDDAIMEVPKAYPRPDQNRKRDGAIAGLETCRGKEPAEIGLLLHHARLATREAAKPAADYWWHRMYETQVEWVANVLSVMLRSIGKATIVPPTVRGYNKAAEIMGA